jgi:hypothetical protein
MAIAEFENLVTLLVLHLDVLQSGGCIFETQKGYKKSVLKALKTMSKLGYTFLKNNAITLPFAIRGKSGIEIRI